MRRFSHGGGGIVDDDLAEQRWHNGYVLSTDGPATVVDFQRGQRQHRFSGLTNAAATKTLANANYAQVWNWDTLATGTALTLGSSS